MGLLSNVLDAMQSYWPYVLVAFFVAHLIRNRYKPVLRDIPGPFLASLTDLWLFQHCFRGKSFRDYELHRKYNSSLLRLGPNTISVADIEASRIIYGWKPVFKKSRLYISQHQTSSVGEVVTNLSSTVDEEKHARIRRPVAHAYAMSTIVEFEPLVDSTSRVFMNEMDERFGKHGIECNLAEWLQMYAFDIIGEITFSHRFGFLESGKDLENMMYHTGAAMDYIGIMGQIPTVDEWFRIKGFGTILRKFRPTNDVVKFTTKQIREHIATDTTKRPDLLTRFIQAREKYPDVMTEAQLAEYANTTVTAGSDTTAIALRELVFRILTHPGSYDCFMDEVKSVLRARSVDTNDDQPITWTEASKMSYFQACIKECLRINSALGQLVPREVPEGGIELCGKWIPAGTVVGCNAWTIHRDKNFYGENADDYDPERWLDPDPQRVRAMDNMSFAFGGGPRVCIGKNIALLEINKFIPEVFRRFEIHLIDPKRYKLRSGWLVLQHGLDVTMRKRDPLSLLE